MIPVVVAMMVRMMIRLYPIRPRSAIRLVPSAVRGHLEPYSPPSQLTRTALPGTTLQDSPFFRRPENLIEPVEPGLTDTRQS
jgi:hypothetical protein